MATRSTRSGVALARPVRRRGILAGLVAVLVLSVLGPMMSYSNLPMTGEGSPVRQIAYLLAFGIVVYGVRPIDNPKRLMVVPLTIVIALGWCWLSMAWSIAPDVAVRRLMLTTLIIWTIFIAIDQLGYERSVTLLRITLAITLIANYLAVFGWPDFGIHQVSEPGDKRLIGDWRGILMHKNFAGAICAITILAFVFDARRIPMAIRTVLIAASAFFLYCTESKTSYGLVGAALVAGFLFQGYNAKYRTAVIAALCAAGIFAAFMFALYKNPFALNFDDKDAFTGRTQIWKALFQYSGDSGLLGAGYGSFWNVGPVSPIYHYASGWVAQVASGHNGFIDLLVTVGPLGLILAVVAAFLAPLVRLLTNSEISAPRGALVLALLLFCVGHNSTESSLFDRDTIVEVVLIFSIALIRPLTAGKAVGRNGIFPLRGAALRTGAG